MPKRYRHRASRVVAATEESDSDSDDASDTLKVYKDTIFYRGDIGQKQATEFCITLRKLADQYHNLNHHITVHLTTDGGDLFAGIIMYEAIRQCRVPVHVVCDACVCSAGTIVMLGAAKRTMYNTSVILVHALSSWVMGMQKPKQLKEELQNCETLLEIMTDVYKRHTRLTKAALKKLYDTDLYMRADECLQMGFVDEVIG